MDFSPPRGTVDLLPPASGAMLALAEEAAHQAELYGYRYVETPAFEATELFARTSGESADVVRKEMYTFQDKGGRSLTLRPEGTAPVVRAYLANAHDLASPFKAYYVEWMWRYGRPQTGRLRQFRQFGIEVIGAGEAEADVEAIAVGDRYLRGCGLGPLELQVNSIGDEQCRPAYRKELLEYLESRRERLRDEHREHFRTNPLRVLDCKDESCRAVSAEAPKISDRLCAPCAKHFDEVREGLEREDLRFVHVPTLVRGLDYYTRTAFEWTSDALPAGQATLGGGGRYDGLAEILGGPATPGIGFAIGLDRVLLALEREGKRPIGREVPDCFVVAVGEGAWAHGREVIRELRRGGLSAEASFEPRSLKAQLRMADRGGASFAVIVGQKEAEAGTVTVRRLSDGHQQELPLDRAIVFMAEGRIPSIQGGPR
jgi:histidyl-tRNA synthetase